jgi:hypothetical protein
MSAVDDLEVVLGIKPSYFPAMLAMHIDKLIVGTSVGS